MKKRIFSFLLVVMMLVMMLPVTVFADETEMSEKIKQILNEEGQLVVTQTTGTTDMVTFLWEYILYNKPESCAETSFNVNSYNVETKIANIGIFGEPESYDVQVVFKEQFSSEFQKILTDGKITLPSTSKHMSAEWISSYLYALGNDVYNFQLASCYVPPENEGEYGKYEPLINEDFTEATVMLYEQATGQKEYHIVQFERVAEPSDAFKDFLNKDNELEMNCVSPEDEMEFHTCFEYLFMYDSNGDGNGTGVDWVADDFSSIDFTINSGKPTMETHTVDVVYNYDADVDKKLEGFIASFPEDIESFAIQDMELVNYWYNNFGTEEGNRTTLSDFSGELKSHLNYNNIRLVVDERAGGDDPYKTHTRGFAYFIFENNIYHVIDGLGTHAEHVVYVPDNTANTAEAMMAAAQARIDEYIGAGKIKLSNVSTLYDAWILQQYEENREYWEYENPNMTLEEFISMGNIYIPAYEKFEDVIYVKGVSEDDIACDVTVVSEDKANRTFHVIIKRDSSKMVVPEYKTVDAKNNVEISSASADVPLDTAIEVDKLTSGEEYEKLVKLLNVTDNDTFDLKLYSESLQGYFTKLDNGTFEVKIPISDKLKGKDLVAYYVDENDKVVEYEVIVKDGYAVFETNHFSIYTVAEAEKPDNTGEGEVGTQPQIEVVVPKDNVADSKLEEKPEAILEKVPFTEEEKAQIEAGAEVVITLEVKDISETVTAEDKTKVEAAVKEVKDQKVGMYLDINMFKQVGNNASVKIPELNGKVKIQLTVPDELLVKNDNYNREYSIIRIHDGKTTVIDAKFDAATKQLVFETDQFSTYALVYKDVAKVPKTGDGTSVVVWMMLFAVGGVAVAYGTKNKNYQMR